MTDAAAALGVRLPTLRTVVKALVRTRWVTRHRSVKDDRVVCLQLGRRGQIRAQSIEIQVRQVRTALTEYDGAALDITPQGSCVYSLAPSFTSLRSCFLNPRYSTSRPGVPSGSRMVPDVVVKAMPSLSCAAESATRPAQRGRCLAEARLKVQERFQSGPD